METRCCFNYIKFRSLTVASALEGIAVGWWAVLINFPLGWPGNTDLEPAFLASWRLAWPTKVENCKVLAFDWVDATRFWGAPNSWSYPSAVQGRRRLELGRLTWKPSMDTFWLSNL